MSSVNQKKKIGLKQQLEFIKSARKSDWNNIVGSTTLNQFLNVLPNRGDNRRNVFTHNKYDNVTKFFLFLVSSPHIHVNLVKDFPMITAYVRKFGLSKTPTLFNTFRTAYQLQNISKKAETLAPKDRISFNDLDTRITDMKDFIANEDSRWNATSFTALERDLFSVFTGKSTHTYHASKRPSLSRIIDMFAKDYANGLISSVPEGYSVLEVPLQRAQMSYKPEENLKEFQQLLQEIGFVANPNHFKQLKKNVEKTIYKKIFLLQNALKIIRKKSKTYLIRQVDIYREGITKLADATTYDQVLSVILDIPALHKDKDIQSMSRQVLLYKVFNINASSHYVAMVQEKLASGVTPSHILFLLNIIEHYVYKQVLLLTEDNKEKYWEENVFNCLKITSHKRYLKKIFAAYRRKLIQQIKLFTLTKSDRPQMVKVIPDRGIIGELAGYLGNSCYTRKYPLLMNRPHLIPMKFILQNVNAEHHFILGSVLVFEVSTEEGKRGLLIRGFNIPEEAKVDISSFLELFFDEMTSIGKKRAISSILIPGRADAISNYPLTVHYLTDTYIHQGKKIRLDKKFNFNGYDITNNCYVVRVIN